MAIKTKAKKQIRRKRPMTEAEMDAEYRRDPYAAIKRATEELKRMSKEEFQKLERQAGILGDDGKLTWYAGGTSPLSKEVSKLPNED